MGINLKFNIHPLPHGVDQENLFALFVEKQNIIAILA